MENQVNSKSIILNKGLLYGLVLVIVSLIIYALGMQFDKTAGYINFALITIIMIAFPILGMSEFKKKNNNYMSWGQGVKIGVGIVFIGTLIGVIYQYIFTTFIEPDFYTQLAEITKNGFVDAGLTEEQIEMQMKIQSKVQGTPIGYASGLLLFTFFGFIVSAIVAAIKKQSEEDQY